MTKSELAKRIEKLPLDDKMMLLDCLIAVHEYYIEDMKDLKKLLQGIKATETVK
jgi:hypothetical protein